MFEFGGRASGGRRRCMYDGVTTMTDDDGRTKAIAAFAAMAFARATFVRSWDPRAWVSDHFFAGRVAGFFAVPVPVAAGFAVEPVPVVAGVADEPVPVDAGVADEPEPVEPEPVEPVEPEPVEPLPIEPLPIDESVPVVEPVPVVLGMLLPVLDVPVLDGVALLPVPDESVVPEFVVALSGDFAGSLSPPQATAPATRAALRTTWESFMRDSEFGRARFENVSTF